MATKTPTTAKVIRLARQKGILRVRDLINLSTNPGPIRRHFAPND